MISQELLNSGSERLQVVEGLTANIERYAINDGYGLRTTVFLKGCPLRCRWCSNPETQEYYQEMSFFQDKCIGCGACISACPKGAIPKNMLADRAVCDLCHNDLDAFACTRVCYAECRKVTGDRQTAKQVVDIVKRDMAFYELSGGGVTISGGEPLAQPEFTYALLRLFVQNWIDTAIETCAFGKREDIEAIAPYLNFVFVDLKHVNAKKHMEWTDFPNEVALENIKLFDTLAAKHGFKLLLRVPVIPDFNDQPEEIGEIGDFVLDNLKNLTGMELLPYHKLGRGKYTSLGRECKLADLNVPSEGQMNALNRVLFDRGIELYQF